MLSCESRNIFGNSSGVGILNFILSIAVCLLYFVFLVGFSWLAGGTSAYISVKPFNCGTNWRSSYK